MRIRLLISAVLIMPSLILPGHAFAAQARSSVLYHPDWTHGLAGWHSRAPGFTAAHGSLNYSGSGVAQIVAPFQTAHLRNFDVDVDIRPFSFDPNAAVLGFGIVVRQPTSYDRTGILAGQFQNVRNAASPIQGAQIAWGNHSIGGVAAAPTGKWQHYRLSVRTYREGYEYSLMIDGSTVIAPIFITADRQFNGVGLWSVQVPLRVRNFRISSFTGNGTTVPQDTPALLALLPAKTPGSVVDNSGHFFSNAEYARGQGLTLTEVLAHGRLLSDVEDLSSDVGAITFGVASFTSPAGAAWEYNRAVAQAQSDGAKLTTYRALPLSALGDQSQAFSYTFSDPAGHPVIVDGVDIVKGTLYFHIEIETHNQAGAVSLIETEALQVLAKV